MHWIDDVKAVTGMSLGDLRMTVKVRDMSFLYTTVIALQQLSRSLIITYIPVTLMIKSSRMQWPLTIDILMYK